MFTNVRIRRRSQIIISLLRSDPFFIASIIRVGSPLLMTGSNEAAVTKESSMRYIRHPHYIAKWRTSALRVNGDVKAAAGWKTHETQRIVNRSNSASRQKKGS